MSKKKLKIICGVSTVIFSLITCASGVAAWFAAVRSVDNSSQNFKAVKPDAMDIGFDMYYKDYNTSKVVKKLGTDENLDLSLQAYNTSYNMSTTVVFNNILKITVTFNHIDSTKKTKSIQTSITCTERTVGDIYNVGPAGATRKYIDTAGYKFHYAKTGEKEADFICDYISNLIQFKGFLYSYKIGTTTYTPQSTPRPTCLVNTDKTIDYTNDTTLFTSASSIFNDVSTINTFVSGSSKSSEINMNFANIPYNADSVEYYIEYNYNSGLLSNYLEYCEYLKNRQFGTSFDPATANLNVTFLKDLVSIKFATED